MSKDIILAAGFVASGLGATGLTVTVDVWRVTLSNLSASEVVTAGSATEIGDGLYAYRVASADLQTYYYYAVFKTAGTADVKHLFGAQLDFSGNTGDTYARLGAPAGASVSADIAALPSASTIATAVWASATRTLTSISALASELRAAVGLASANLDTQLDALPTANENADALLDRSSGIETSITLRQALRLVLAASAGKLSGAAGATVTIRNVGDSKDRIVATVDADGNRTAVTTDVT